MPSGFSMSTISSFKCTENKHYVYRGKDCLEKFSESLRKHAVKIIKFKKKNKEVVIKRAAGIIWKCYICKDKFGNNYLTGTKCCRVRDYRVYT